MRREVEFSPNRELLQALYLQATRCEISQAVRKGMMARVGKQQIFLFLFPCVMNTSTPLCSTVYARLWGLGLLLLLVIPAKAQRFVGYSSQVQKAGTASSRKLEQAEQAVTADIPTKKYESTRFWWQTALLADGDFSKSISEKEGATPKTGSLGINFTRIKHWENQNDRADSLNIPHFQGNIVVSLGSQGDTLTVQPNVAGTGRAVNQYDFGQALLLPGSNAKVAKSFTANVLWRPHLLSTNAFTQTLSYNLFVNVTQTRWRYQNKIEDVRLLFLSAGLLFTVFEIPANEDNNSVKLELLLNGTMRHIAGDVREEKEILTQALGSNQYWYFGADPGLVITVNSLRVSASFPFYGGNVKGFSNGQFVAALGFSTSLNLTK